MQTGERGKNIRVDLHPRRTRALPLPVTVPTEEANMLQDPAPHHTLSSTHTLSLSLFLSLSLTVTSNRTPIMFADDSYLDQDHDLHLSSSLRDVNYSCGSCGYQLNLNSCNRNTSVIGSKYGKSIKKGIISFFSIDESRFTQIVELRCIPYFTSKRSWGLFQRRTKLLCRKCGSHIGNAYKDNTSSYPLTMGKPNSISWDGISDCRMFDIKIRALLPLSAEEPDIFT
ncbi:hypothetical protein L1049_020127 [Liquidambar formosana]|uniref:Uncharacterized protein n=1 Tax=Liquidambar formosana TaxID=63359 RepID=A0AAP0S9D5_LIQFO